MSVCLFFIITGQLICDAINCMLRSTPENTPVYLSPFPKASGVHNSPLRIVSTHLAARAQHLKLRKCGIYSPTTKGLHEGDMSRDWQWFDIEIAQWKVTLLWLFERRTPNSR